MKLTFSVAMCTFNGSRFLPAQLRSIAEQTRLPDEVVICDDGSSDGSDAIGDAFAGTAPFPVRMWRNQTTFGVTANFEKAISLCESSIVVLADQDDVWYRHKLTVMENALLAADEIVAVFSDADLIDDRSQPAHRRLWESFSFSRREQKRFFGGDALRVLIKHPVVTGATMAFRRNLLDRLLPIPAGQMHDTWLAFLLAASGRILPIAEPLMQYRRHQSQQIGPGLQSFRERRLRAQCTGPDFYLGEARHFREIQQRLEKQRTCFPYAECALREIENKIAHRERRATLPRNNAARISVVIREIFNRGYWRYSQGWQSAAKDLAGLTAKQKTAMLQQRTDAQR